MIRISGNNMPLLKMIKDLKPGLPLPVIASKAKQWRGIEGEVLNSKKKSLAIVCGLLSVVCCLLSINLFAQNSSRQKIATFVPLYLDSAFDATNSYRYDKSFPKF